MIMLRDAVDIQVTDDIFDGGERVVHLMPDEVFFAHLSIYRFALQYCYGKNVFDAGSGSGYGANYLAENGATFVQGVDISEKAVIFSRKYFRRPNLQFQTMDLSKIKGFDNQSFDIIFSSNVLEHIQDVHEFLLSALYILKTDGVMIVAVPPIFNNHLFSMNIANPYHLNIWTPIQWHAVLCRYFAQVDCYIHRKIEAEKDYQAKSGDYDPSHIEYAFDLIDTDQLLSPNALTSIFVLRQPIAANSVPYSVESSFVDDSFTRMSEDRQTAIIAKVVLQREQEIARLTQIIAEREQRLRQLEADIDRKNRHIAYCEDLLRRIEAGRLIRLTRWLTRAFHRR
jgi:SAM-dependent methyltransferase